MQTLNEIPADNQYQFCHAVCWKSILAGAVTASVVSLILLALGSGIGLAVASPFSADPVTIAGFTVTVGVWMIIMQWLSAGLGGYLAGRLRKKHLNVHADEAFFRDTAHGFLTWAVATLITAVLLTSAAASVISGGAKAATVVSASAAAGAGQEMASHPDAAGDEHGYYIDSLFRNPTANVPAAESNMEATRIVLMNLKADSFPEADKQYLAQLVSARTGVSLEEAAARVDETIAKMTEAKQEAMEAAEKARKASSAFSICLALSMLLGAFIASVAAAIGSGHRDFRCKV